MDHSVTGAFKSVPPNMLSTSSHYTWRQANPTDLQPIFDLSEIIHPDFPEDIEVFANRMQLYPEGTFVLLNVDHEIIGYAVTHPTKRETPPELDVLFQTIPQITAEHDSLDFAEQQHAYWYYLHDVAISPKVRNSGAAKIFVDIISQHAREKGYDTIHLTSVNNSLEYWKKRGFVPKTDLSPKMIEKMASYGADAYYMTKKLNE